MKNKNIIYIAGYGRSGSTLLERILSSNKKIFGTGELSNLLQLINSDETSFCSCGEEVCQCKFWSDIIQEICKEYDVNKLKELQYRLESVINITGNQEKLHTDFVRVLFKKIFQNVSSEVEYIIDSSKTARKSFFRPIIFSKINFLNIKVIHLVRDGRGCMWSNLKGSNRKMEKGVDPHLPFAALRTAISWPLANTSPHIFRMFSSSENYHRVKYEDFVEQPNKVLSDLGEFLNIDFSEQIEMLKNKREIPLGHQLSGNRLRKKKKIILQKDVEWKDKLSVRHKLLFWLLDWPFALLYDYK